MTTLELTTENYLKVTALAQSQDMSIEDAIDAFENGDWLIYDDAEADDAVAEYIKQSLWAFNASFLSRRTDLPEEIFTALQDKCEGANDAFLALVEKHDSLDDFVDAAVSADGRGHFLSSYDGEEIEHSDFYLYRVN